VKKGDKVKFKGKSRSGIGEIVSIKDSLRGKFYEVKPDGEGKSITLRAAQLTAI
jgi:hypothetical protein